MDDFMNSGVIRFYSDRPTVRHMLPDYEPDYDAYIATLDSLEASMARVSSYNDWFVDEN